MVSQARIDSESNAKFQCIPHQNDQLQNNNSSARVRWFYTAAAEVSMSPPNYFPLQQNAQISITALQLKLLNVDVSSAGLYGCALTNKVGSSPIAWTRLHVSVTGSPEPTISWSHKGLKISNQARIVQVLVYLLASNAFVTKEKNPSEYWKTASKLYLQSDQKFTEPCFKLTSLVFLLRALRAMSTTAKLLGNVSCSANNSHGSDSATAQLSYVTVLEQCFGRILKTTDGFLRATGVRVPLQPSNYSRQVASAQRGNLDGLAQ
ncbi:hypothetical protein Ciccas_005702 [Cichlidogyrus casuarinus]|uniref:Ig-like domain-containing protein n=1 Tax=Cichlidogyrus casuarinus TaxID=1844966 RepID=A0ABD2Q859_9PLAT